MGSYSYIRGLCEAELWSTVPAVAFVAIMVVFALPIPLPRSVCKIFGRIRAPFLPSLTLAQAEELERRFSPEIPSADGVSLSEHRAIRFASWWHTRSFTALALVEVVAWLVVAILNVVFASRDPISDRRFVALPFLTATTWGYALARVLHKPPITPPFDLFVLGILHLSSGIFILGGQLYRYWMWEPLLPSGGNLTAEIFNLGIIIIFLGLIVNLPFNVPSADANRDKVGTAFSPEDYSTLASWMSLSWIQPLVNAGKSEKLNDEDVWGMSTTLKTRPTFFLYLRTPGTSVFWRLLRANSMDLIVDFIFAEVTVLLEFAGPFLLKNILEGLENSESVSRSLLYVYATLAFTASLLESEADLLHGWHGLRAASRIGTQLSAAIYDKALRITDPSGVVSAPEVLHEDISGQDAKAAYQGEIDNGVPERTTNDTDHTKDPKLPADVGKIINLMGIDCQKLQNVVSTMTDIYIAPLQLVLSCVYLYRILGISAFAGFISLVVAAPLSQWLSKITMHITQRTLAAKDSRMSLINEMFSAIKFIKFSAWEDQWIKRVMNARVVEIQWLKKSRNVNVVYSFLWTLVPSLVSMVSFSVYVYTGHELTVSTAFTAIRLFDMLRYPLGALPYALVTLAQTKVSLDRLDAFFKEREVPDYVSSLTRRAKSTQQKLTLENASFRWMASREHNSNNIPNTEPFARVHDEPASIDEGPASTSSRPSKEHRAATDQPFELKSISLQPSPGTLTVITGPTASGKSALLRALLGEMEIVSGHVSLPKNPTIVDEHGLTNSIAYAVQTPWLQQLSIKDNIVFGHSLNQERYDAVVKACALQPDFEMLEDGDLTEIGSRGVSLSGGQKARVALARAVYAPTQYLILDDIFSAVDSHTARFLFDNLLRGPLLAHRTVLLVTHHVNLVLPATHYVIRMLDGRVDHQGTLAELKQNGLLDYVVHDPSVYHNEEIKVEISIEDTATYDGNETVARHKLARKLVEEEMRAEGTVAWSIYKTYLKAASYWTWVCVMLGIVAAATLDVGTRVWVSIWGSAYPQSPKYIGPSAGRRIRGHLIQGEQWPTIHDIAVLNLTAVRDIAAGFPDAHLHPLFYVAVYCGIGVAAAVAAMCTQWVLFTGGLRSGRVLFQGVLASLSAATFRFYDTTPMGRILNRFGRDFDTVDGMLPFILYNTITSTAAIVAPVLTILVVIPWFLPVGAILVFLYFRLSLGYLRTSRDLRRMESTSRSPILAGFSDLLDGLVTIRAFSAEIFFVDGHYKKVDTANRFWYFTWILNRWLRIRFDVLGAASVYAATLFVLSRDVSVAFAGLSIVSAMVFSTSVYWTCRAYTDLELCLNSVERVVGFLEVPKETGTVVQSNRVPAYWPSSSNFDSLLVVEDLEVKYAADLPSVLHGISFALKARERVGLLGRTGCGKSTLAMSILRFVDPCKGRIMLDGIDIATIGTHDLRSRVTFIAQDQALFLGTVRDNLDPFNQHTDVECLDVLSRVRMITDTASASHGHSGVPSKASSVHDRSTSSTGSPVINSKAAMGGDAKITISLDTKVSAGGTNFSSGQRQLLAMARALLKQNAVVILDEATSSVDKATDMIIQAAIREEFKRSLLLTIAHRLETIIDFDRLIVLDKGRIVEFDTPFNLMQRNGGVFREMCMQSGSFQDLEATAKAHAEEAAR